MATRKTTKSNGDSAPSKQTRRKAATAGIAAAGGPSPVPADVQVRIAERAYLLFRNRGGQPGRELDDWLEAERQVRTETDPA